MRLHAYKVLDSTVCRCRKRCARLVGDDTPHRTGYWVAYRMTEDGKQDGPAVQAWTLREAEEKARNA